MGRILVVNTLIASLLVYKLTVLPSPSKATMDTLKFNTVKYIWNGAKPKIAYDTLVLTKKEGGLGLCDLELKNKALKIAQNLNPRNFKCLAL